MKLMEGFINYEYIVDKMNLEKKEKEHFYRMHMKEGSCIKIIRKQRGYPFLIEMDGTRIAFSRRVASQIEVIPHV